MKQLPIIWIFFVGCFFSVIPGNSQTTAINFLSNDFKNPQEKNTKTTHFTLHKDAYLSLSFRLEQPLLAYLKTLAPKLSDKELLAKGNFQFLFYVDNQLIYTENLHPGAGSATSKSTQLNYQIPLIYPKPLDFWGWFMWLKFMKMGGGRDALTIENHELKIELKPYIQLKNKAIGALIAKGTLPITVQELPYDARLVNIQEIAPAKGWKRSNANYDTNKIKELHKKIAQGRFEHINGIVVAKSGELLIESYFNGATRESLHDPRSVGKTMASTLTGLAIHDGYIKDEHTLLKNYYNIKDYKHFSSKKEQVSLHSLLSMSSGFIGDDTDPSNIGNEENMYPTKNWVDFVLNLPMDKNTQVGERYRYFTGGVVLLGDIIHKSVPGGLVAYADKKLFKPLGIINYQWEYTPQKVGNTAGGIRLRAIDFAKYGQLYKNNGVWEGKQLIPRPWIEKSLSKQIKQSYAKDRYYGYLFWNRKYKVHGKGYEVYYCSGNGGNKILIFKELPLVIVITASGYNLPYMHTDVDKVITDYILPAVIN